MVRGFHPRLYYFAFTRLFYHTGTKNLPTVCQRLGLVGRGRIYRSLQLFLQMWLSQLLAVLASAAMMLVMLVASWMMWLYRLRLCRSWGDGLGGSSCDNPCTIRPDGLLCGCNRCGSRRHNSLMLHTRLWVVNRLWSCLCHTSACSNNCDCYQAKYILHHNCILLSCCHQNYL